MKPNGVSVAAGKGENIMNKVKPNKYGLFDKAVRISEKERIVLFEDDIERQLEAGAFDLEPDEAVREGFINPYDEQDTVIVSVSHKSREE